MSKLKWKKLKPRPRKPWNTRYYTEQCQWLASMKDGGGFKIHHTYNGFSLHRYVGMPYNAIHIATFNKIESAQKVAQLIYNR